MHRTGGLLLMVFLVIMMALPGCNKADTDFTLDVNACAETLRETIAFQDTLTAISDQMIAVIYPIDAQDVVKQKVYVSSGATAEEIAVFEAVDVAAAQRIETAVWQRVADQKTSFQDYVPSELPKLADPFLSVNGKYVILCISGHNEAVKTELNKLFNKQGEKLSRGDKGQPYHGL
ncbi:DUF4358 domain-containing protein [Pelotomaculum terephthalicicum JT]|uniref:DUF4358 domain-containing protein n=1 Tax=Pelotomaculum terephthalicicum TaxID=206393 RepID=UPI001F0500DA|nr:DUF4358 domain-containing protein [Pelotomaculum terephthalicicum]MCG9969519.1 DUF4358 domain-containing protein [Pelotomaculum terephthalicicum JT]